MKFYEINFFREEIKSILTIYDQAKKRFYLCEKIYMWKINK